jgi:hypothetical protein
MQRLYGDKLEDKNKQSSCSFRLHFSRQHPARILGRTFLVVHEQPYDGKKHRCLVALFLPVSQHLLQLEPSENPDNFLGLNMHSITPFVRSVGAVKACRCKILVCDLLTLRSDHTLFILTFEGSVLIIDFILNDSLWSRVANQLKSYEVASG